MWKQLKILLMFKCLDINGISIPEKKKKQKNKNETKQTNIKTVNCFNKPLEFKIIWTRIGQVIRLVNDIKFLFHIFCKSYLYHKLN